jgi:phage terminase small subunit
MVGRPKIQPKAYQPHKFEESLTVQQRLFAEELIADPFMSSTEAAIKAGYKKETAQVKGSQLLKHPVISRMIGHALNERIKRTQITQDEVLNILINAATLDPMAIFEQDADGSITMKQLASIPPELRILITEMDATTKTTFSLEGEPVKTTRFKIKWIDKLVAVQMLMKHMGMIEPDTKVNIHMNMNVVSQLRETITQRNAKVIDGSVIDKMARGEE